MTVEIKVGMVGLDTSHCEAFAKILHDAEYEYHLPGARIVGAYPGGSAQFSKSRERVQGYTDTLHKGYGVKLYDSLATLVNDVDAIFLESVDGRQHPEQFDQLAVGKPIFIDKPFAVSAADARTMINKAQATQTPIMSCSSLRYAAGIADLISTDEKVVAGETFGPAVLLNDFPGLFWYGIHSAEMLFVLMGTGCKQVQCIERTDVDIVIGDWAEGRPTPQQRVTSEHWRFSKISRRRWSAWTQQHKPSLLSSSSCLRQPASIGSSSSSGRCSTIIPPHGSPLG